MRAFIFMVGTTGAGKTTHGKILAEKLGATYLSTGDIARELMDPATAKEFSEGKLSPYEDAIRTRVSEVIHASKVIIFDGFPRVPEQMEWLRAQYPGAKHFKLELLWQAPVIINRWLKRMRDEFDTMKVFVLRNEIFYKETLPIFEKMPGGVLMSDKELEVMDVCERLWKEAVGFLNLELDGFTYKYSEKQRLIDKFIREHHVQKWMSASDHSNSYACEADYIEKKIWEIVHA